MLASSRFDPSAALAPAVIICTQQAPSQLHGFTRRSELFLKQLLRGVSSASKACITLQLDPILQSTAEGSMLGQEAFSADSPEPLYDPSRSQISMERSTAERCALLTQPETMA